MCYHLFYWLIQAEALRKQAEIEKQQELLLQKQQQEQQRQQQAQQEFAYQQHQHQQQVLQQQYLAMQQQAFYGATVNANINSNSGGWAAAQQGMYGASGAEPSNATHSPYSMHVRNCR